VRNHRATAILVGILCVSLGFGLFGSGRTKAEPQAEQAKLKLDKLQKKMPDVFLKWWKQNGGTFFENTKFKSKMELLRWIAATEVKITYSCSLSAEEGLDQDFIMTFYLHYYDGKWTTTGVTSSSAKIPGADMMLLIDKTSAE
jgi:hypothetical protein